MTPRAMEISDDTFALRETFTISRGSKNAVHVVSVAISDGVHTGQGECVPYARYGETVDGVKAALEAMRPAVLSGLDNAQLQSEMPAGAARNALDCALLDYAAKVSGRPVWDMLDLPEPKPFITAYTISLDTAENMAANAARNAHRPLMKLKLTGEGDLERVGAVAAAAPNTRLVVDANEGWQADMVEPFSKVLADLGVVMIEQPLPADQDKLLADVPHPVPLCADESAHTTDTLPDLIGRYEMINIKLDKTGGLTEALRLRRAAEAAGMKIMIGCMMGTSLSMAPAILLAEGAAVVDLDASLLLGEDRSPALHAEGSLLHPADPELWG